MIIIAIDYKISIQNADLNEGFEKIKNKILNKKSLREISLIYEIIERDPTPEIIEDIIFNNRSYHLLIKHDSLIRAIELGYFDIVNKVVLFSSSADLVKTALNYINDDDLLRFIVLGANFNLAETRKYEIQNLALMGIKDENVFCETFKEGYSMYDYQRIFKKIKHKSRYKVMSGLQKRVVPFLIPLLPKDEAFQEFSRKNKYPRIITDLVTNW